MAQHDYTIDNQTGANFRTDLNNALSAIQSSNSGAIAPASTTAGQIWFETDTNLLKFRNSADNGWIDIVNLSTGKFTNFTSTGIDDNANSTALTINSNENVGIGTTTADRRLVVSRLGGDLSSTPTLNANVTAVFHSGAGASGSGSGISLLGGNTADCMITFDDLDAAQKGRIIYRHSSDSMAFETSAAEAMRIDGSGHVIIPNGVTLGTAAGTYTISNTLDDYEEGTFTATLTADTTPPNTPPTVTGYYTKIGRKVTIQFRFAVVNTTGASGQAKVTGLPFAAMNVGGSRGFQGVANQTVSTLIQSDNSQTYTDIYAYVLSSTDYVIFNRQNLTTQTINLTSGTSKYVGATVTYFTN